MRWAAVQAVQRIDNQSRLEQLYDQVGARRGRNIDVVAAARELEELVFYGLRDGTSAAWPAPPHEPAPDCGRRGSCVS